MRTCSTLCINIFFFRIKEGASANGKFVNIRILTEDLIFTYYYYYYYM